MSDTHKYTNKLVDTNTLVVGGTSGIGFCVAENLLENGAYVTIASSRKESIDNAMARLQKSYPNAASTHLKARVVDMKQESSIAELLRFATDDGKQPLDHIAETSGDAISLKPLEEITEDDIIEGQRVRWMGAIYLAKHSKGLLKPSSASSLTLTGGINSYQPGKDWFMTAGVSSGKDGFARGLAVNFAPIRVNLVAPGPVFTELYSKMIQDPDALENFKAGFAAATLVGEIGKPEDLAEAFVYCMRDRFLDGQVILSDGGMLLAPGRSR